MQTAWKYYNTKFGEKKLWNSLKLHIHHCPFIQYIVLKGYTWSISFDTFCWKVSISWIYLEASFASYPDLKPHFSGSLKRFAIQFHDKMWNFKIEKNKLLYICPLRWGGKKLKPSNMIMDKSMLLLVRRYFTIFTNSQCRIWRQFLISFRENC